MSKLISMDEVVTNLTMYTIGVRKLGECPCSDGIYDPDQPDMSMIEEHECTNVTGIIEDVPPAAPQEKSNIKGNRVIWQWKVGQMKKDYGKKKKTVLAVKGVYMNGKYYDKLFIKA
jgi:hypothetical protein